MGVLKLASFVKTCLTPAANVIFGWANMVGRPKAISKIGNKEQAMLLQLFLAKRLYPCGGQKPSMVQDMSTGQAYRRPRAVLMKAWAPHPFVASQRAKSLKQCFEIVFSLKAKALQSKNHQHQEYGFCKRFCLPQANRRRRSRTI